MVSAKLVIPDSPRFPILVSGQVICKDTISFMRKLDLKELHGCKCWDCLIRLRRDGVLIVNTALKMASMVEAIFKCFPLRWPCFYAMSSCGNQACNRSTE